MLSPFRKAIASLVTGAVTWATAVTVSDPGPITSGEWVTAGGMAAAAFLVWWIPNEGSA